MFIERYTRQDLDEDIVESEEDSSLPDKTASQVGQHHNQHGEKNEDLSDGDSKQVLEVIKGEEETFKKRYGDLRRHVQETNAQKQKEIDSLRKQLQDTARDQIRFPKSAEEVKSWTEKYPDVAATVDTIAQYRANEAVTRVEEELAKVRKLEEGINRDRARLELSKIHSDFEELRSSDDFHEWVDDQPEIIKDALYTNTSDHIAASRVIDLYKADKGIPRKGKIKTKKETDLDAALSVSTSSQKTPITGPIKNKYSESVLAKMSDKEFEEQEADIMKAIRSGKFDYDVGIK